MIGHYTITELSTLQCSDGPPQSSGYDKVSPASILLEGWAYATFNSIACGSISRLCKSPGIAEPRDIIALSRQRTLNTS